MLLTLDLSSRNIGWTYGEALDEDFSSGAQPFESTGEDIGAFGYLLHGWLVERLIGVTVCVFEAPIFHQAKASLPIMRKLYGAAFYLETLCTMRKIKCFEANVQDLKTFMGVSRARGVNQKREMVTAVERYGYQPASDDEADAIAIRLYYLHQRYPEHRARFGLELGALSAAATMGSG